MSGLDRNFVQHEVDQLLDVAKKVSAPVDLSELAIIRHVLGVDLRPMIPEGYLMPVPGGFQVFMRNPSFQRVDFGDGQGWQPLRPRQRFTMAHEIAHTLFYDIFSDPPAPLRGVPKTEILESLCQFGGALMVVPDRLLTDELKDEKQLTVGLALSLAKRFWASLEVVVRRVSEVDGAKMRFRDSGLVLATPDASGQDAQITGAYVGAWLRPYFRSAVTCGDKLGTCWGNLIPADFWSRENWRGAIDEGPGELRLQKMPHPGGGKAFLLEMQLRQK